MIDAQTALNWGLVDVIVTGGAEGADVQSFLKPVFDRSPLVLRSIKQQALAWRQGLSYAACRGIERKNLVATWLSNEHWAAVDRFLAKDKESGAAILGDRIRTDDLPGSGNLENTEEPPSGPRTR